MAASLPLKKLTAELAVGEEGADLACTGTSSSSDRSAGGNSSETLRFWWRENLGIGRELGGGELENAGPAQSSGREGGDVEGLIEIALLRFFPWRSCCFGVLGSGEERVRATPGAGGDGRMPMVMPEWKARQLPAWKPRTGCGEEKWGDADDAFFRRPGAWWSWWPRCSEMTRVSMGRGADALTETA